MAWGVGLLMADRAGRGRQGFPARHRRKAAAGRQSRLLLLSGRGVGAGRADRRGPGRRPHRRREEEGFRPFPQPRGLGAVRRQTLRRGPQGLRRVDPTSSTPTTIRPRPATCSARPGWRCRTWRSFSGDMPAAEEWLEQVLDEFPDDDGALNDLGYLWADQNKDLAAGQADDPNRPSTPSPTTRPTATAWAGCCSAWGKYPRPSCELEKAAADKKPDGTVLDHLGDAYARLNQPRQGPRSLAKGRRRVSARERNGKGQGRGEKIGNDNRAEN